MRPCHTYSICFLFPVSLPKRRETFPPPRLRNLFFLHPKKRGRSRVTLVERVVQRLAREREDRGTVDGSIEITGPRSRDSRKGRNTHAYEERKRETRRCLPLEFWLRIWRATIYKRSGWPRVQTISIFRITFNLFQRIKCLDIQIRSLMGSGLMALLNVIL